MVARLVRHSHTRSFFFFLLLTVSFQRCVVCREYAHYSRAFSPHLTLLFIASILTPRECPRLGSFLVRILRSSLSNL